MAEYFFFTEPEKLKPQTEQQSFGVIDEHQFRIGNAFSATSACKVFAITAGNVLIQQVAGSDQLVNIVLKPFDQPDTDLPKIDYIIYKGVQKSALVAGEFVAEASKNDLTLKIWESHQLQLANIPDTPEKPSADAALGLGFNELAADSGKALDTDPLDQAFFNHERALFPVEAGDYLGDFEKDSLGLVIVFERIGYRPTFGLARSLESVFSVDALAGSPTEAEKFRQMHEKETVINFIDSTAFFGTFLNTGIKLIQSNSPVTFQGDQLYDVLLDKHHNKNLIYLDIRNEYEDSYNYYRNYANKLYLDLSTTANFTEHDYYDGGWPVIAIFHEDFEANDAAKRIGLRLPVGDNYFPRVYLKSGYQPVINEEDVPDPSKKYLEANTADDYLELSEYLETPKKSTSNQLIANYFQLKYIKRFTTPQDSLKGLSLRKESYLDNLFPIFELKTPYTLKSGLDTKVFQAASLIDKSNINESEFRVDIGVAVDNQLTSFIAYPREYNKQGINRFETLPLTSEQNSEGDNFIDYFNKKIVDEKIEKKVFVTEDLSPEYLSFAQEDNSLIEVPEEEDATVYEAYEEPPLEKRYDLDNTNIISFSQGNFNQLAAISETEFPGPYKVYLGVADTDYLTVDENAESTTVFALRGLRETDAGEIETYEYITDIDVFAEDDLYNWENDTAECEIIEAYWSDPFGNPNTSLPYGVDEKTVVIYTHNAIGKTLTINMVQTEPEDKRITREIGNVTITEAYTYHHFEFKPEFYDNQTSENIKEYHLEIKVCNMDFQEFAKGDGERLKVHAVRFVPNALKQKGWEMALKSQDLWFNGSPNDNLYSENTPVVVDFVTIDWINSFPRAEAKYKEMINIAWKSEKSINVLRGELKDMKNDGLFDWPTSDNPTVEFGSFDKTIILKTGVTVKDIVKDGVQRMPFIEKYFYAGVNVGITDDDPLDDLFGTFGSYNWHATAKGKLKFVNKPNKVGVVIEQIAVYVRDQFDYTTEVETLGDWKLDKNFDVKKNYTSYGWAKVGITWKSPPDGYISIHNSDYRAYRTAIEPPELRTGGDYWQYSELKILDKNYEFEMDIS